MLSAAGIGAILAPPTMGAAAFVIAEFLKISYLQVLLMAIVPALLYYLSVFLMIEADSRRLGTRPAAVAIAPLAEVTRRGGYHFISLFGIGVLLVAGVSTFRAVFWATLLAIGLSFVRRDTALWPRRLVAALDAGGRGVLSVAATTATAGIIVGVVTLTGLGLKVAGLIVALAGGHLVLTVVYAALAVWLLGLAVPVTASYIIAAVMVAPAMTSVGVAPLAAHMFIFYYAVLSEVSPPTALAPFAAAALTGGNPFKTMMLTWKYTLPAFLVPFVFTLDPRGMGVLLRGPAGDIVRATATAALGVVALAAGFGGWMRRAATLPERVLAVAGGALLFYPGRRRGCRGRGDHGVRRDPPCVADARHSLHPRRDPILGRAEHRRLGQSRPLRHVERVAALLDRVDLARGRQHVEEQPQFGRCAEGVSRALHHEHRVDDVRQVRHPDLLRLAGRVQGIAEEHEAAKSVPPRAGRGVADVSGRGDVGGHPAAERLAADEEGQRGAGWIGGHVTEDRPVARLQHRLRVGQLLAALGEREVERHHVQTASGEARWRSPP